MQAAGKRQGGPQIGGMRSPRQVSRMPVNKVLPVTTSMKYLATDVTFGSVAVSALLDTACSRTLMSEYFFENNVQGRPCEKKREIENFAATTASNDILKSSKKVYIHFKIKPYSWTFPFFVIKELPHDVILGLDFMHFTSMSLNIQNSSFTFSFGKNITFPVLETNIEQPQTNAVKINQNLPQHQQNKFTQLIAEFPDVITKRLGRTNLVEYDIELTDDTPVRSRPYAYAPPKMEELRRHVAELLDQGVVSPSSSHYSSPAFL